jgi:hypothetical protein
MPLPSTSYLTPLTTTPNPQSEIPNRNNPKSEIPNPKSEIECPATRHNALINRTISSTASRMPVIKAREIML